MKRYILLFLLLFNTSLFAYEWSNDNITIVSKTQDEDRTSVTLKDQGGNIFNVQYYNTLEEQTAKTIIRLKSDFYGWQNMKVDNLNFTSSEGGLQIAVVPKQYQYKNVDINQYLPSGMLFTYTTQLQYNFRINVSRLFVRIVGDFKDENKLSDKIVDAIQNPQEYIKRREPEYLLMQIERLEDEFQKLRYAVLALHNKGVFSGPEQINRDTISHIVNMRINNPKITADEISKSLEKDKIKASDREINLILNIYFNQFQK